MGIELVSILSVAVPLIGALVLFIFLWKDQN